MDYKGTALRNVDLSHLECAPARAFSRISSSRATLDTTTSWTASLLRRISKYFPSTFFPVSMQNSASLNLFSLYRESLIESTRFVDSFSLSMRSHKTYHFYTISCEVYLGRMFIFHCNYAAICCVKRAVTIDRILMNSGSCLYCIAVYNYIR